MISLKNISTHLVNIHLMNLNLEKNINLVNLNLKSLNCVVQSGACVKTALRRFEVRCENEIDL